MRSVDTEFSWPLLTISGDKNFLSSLYWKAIFHMGVLPSAFWKKRGSLNVLLTPAIIQVLLAENNHYVIKVEYSTLHLSKTL